MKTSVIFLILIIFVALKPDYAKAELVNSSAWLDLGKKSYFRQTYSVNSPLENSFGVSTKYDGYNLSSNLTLAFSKNNNLIFDGTYLDYKKRNISFGIGKKYRHWSFSPKSSLFISNNARPTNSLYFKVETNHKGIMSWAGDTSFEVFNSILNNTDGPKNSMLLGARAIIAPRENLKFEFIKISQWGGDKYGTDFTNLRAAILGNTNEGADANINQLAGFGLSYKLPKNMYPVHFYAQLLGEDEAGNLPSCFSYFLGVDWKLKNITTPTSFGIEYIDTRVNTTRNGNCGTNTAYNNHTYKYTNFEKVLGAKVDSEGKMLTFSSSFQLTPKLNMSHITSRVLVNEANYANHRLSANREFGWYNSIRLIWAEKNVRYMGTIDYQGMDLEKVNSFNGTSFSINASVLF